MLLRLLRDRDLCFQIVYQVELLLLYHKHLFLTHNLVLIDQLYIRYKTSGYVTDEKSDSSKDIIE